MEPFERIYDVDYDAGDSDSVRGSDSSGDEYEDFDCEMQRELDKRLGINNNNNRETESLNLKECLRSKASSLNSAAGPSTAMASEPMKENNDSVINADDEALYDPDEDEDNERWAQQQRRAQIYPGSEEKTVPLPTSHAILTCPGCMTVLCRDCQAHDTIAGQYRAIFVNNCRVDETTSVSAPLVWSDKQRKRRRGKNSHSLTEENEIIFHPFYCSFCNTRIGVMDSDEVYHFLQALAS